MSKGGLGFRATVVAGVLSALITAFITWLLGFWPAIWSWIVKATVTLWGWVTYSIPVPAGIFVLVAVVFLYRWRRQPHASKVGDVVHQRSHASRPAPTDNILPQHTESASNPSLSKNEIRIVHLFAVTDGKWLGIDDIASNIELPRLLVEQALERLNERGFLKTKHNSVHGTFFRLSSEGRDYAIDQGYV